jgi:branched-chain amino acid transport system permease protein
MLRERLGRYLIPVALLVVFFGLPSWTENLYIVHMLIMMYLNIILAVGVTMIFRAGSLTMGHAAYAMIGAYTSVLLVTRLELPFWLAFFCAGGFTALIAFFVGYITLGVRGIYFTITTFAFGEVLRGIVTAFPNPFGGPGGIRGIPHPPGIESKVEFYYFVFVFMVISIFIYYRLSRGQSYFGLICDGLRLNQLLEECLGVNTKTIRIVVFVLGCAFAGFVGSITAHYLTHMNPDTFSIMMSTDLVVFCAAGGLGSIPGAVIGAAILTLIGELLYGIGFFKSLIFGALLIGIVLFLPRGVMTFTSQKGIKSISRKKSVRDASTT